MLHNTRRARLLSLIQVYLSDDHKIFSKRDRVVNAVWFHSFPLQMWFVVMDLTDTFAHLGTLVSELCFLQIRAPPSTYSKCL